MAKVKLIATTEDNELTKTYEFEINISASDSDIDGTAATDEED